MNQQLLLALFGVTAAVTSAAATIAGIVVSRRLDTRQEREKDLRERRVRSYQDLASEYFVLREAMRRVALTSLDSDETADRIEDARQAGIMWNRAVIAVWMHGAPATAALARDVDHQVNELFKSARTGQFTIEEWYSIREPSQELIDLYLEAVRVELDLPTLGKRLTDYTVRLTGE